jgi:hypothetical protein
MTNFASSFDFIVNSANNVELDNLLVAIKERRDRLTRVAKYTMRVGQAVKFNHRGVEYAGKIVTIKSKKALVNVTSPRMWSVNVPMNMLEVA